MRRRDTTKNVAEVLDESAFFSPLSH